VAKKEIQGEIQREKVDSALLRSIGYDEEHQLLQVEWCSGGIGNYTPVSRLLYTLLGAARSKGRFMRANIISNHKIQYESLTGKKSIRIDAELKVAAPVYLALLNTRKSVRAGGHFLHSLWRATGQENPITRNGLYARTMLIIEEASGEVKKTGPEYLEGAIQIAKRRRI
jgi:hypothetical protein